MISNLYIIALFIIFLPSNLQPSSKKNKETMRYSANLRINQIANFNLVNYTNVHSVLTIVMTTLTVPKCT